MSLLVTDLDNTLWDWFSIWHQSFGTLLQAVSAASGVSTEVLEPQIRAVHQLRGTSEYSYLLNELPALDALHPGQDAAIVYADAIEKFRAARRQATRLYPGVLNTLRRVKSSGTPVVAYTESLSFYSAKRIKALDLDGIIDVLYSSPDHDFPEDVTPADLRSQPDSAYELLHTEHRYVPAGVLKPDPLILKEIGASMGVDPSRTVYVGDSLMKDVAMAQATGVADVWAAYGAADHRNEYELLRRVSHWTQADVEREKKVSSSASITPGHTLDDGFAQLLDMFDFGSS